MKLTHILSAFLLPLLCGAAAIPTLTVPQGVGVNIHFVTGHEKDLDLIAAAGFKFIRMDFGWGGIETKKGQYDWSGYDQLLDNLEKRGVRALFILDYSNGLYEETVTSKNPITGKEHKSTASPQHPESVAAFARWAAAAAKHYQGRNIIWEIWNEPNISFWSPKPDAAQYAALALATCKALRAADPQATILGPASSGFPWEFIETLFKAGALEYLDAVSVHPYRDYKKGPETAVADYDRLRTLIDRYAPTAKNGKLPIVSGEWGYSTFNRGVSLETQAAFAARQQLSNLLNKIPISIWYDWKNDGPDAAEREHNFGVVAADLAPKPAYVAIRTLTEQLSGYTLARRIKMDRDEDYVLEFTKGSSRKLATWTLAETHPATVELDGRKITGATGVDSGGEPFTPTVNNARISIQLSASPAYLTLN